MTKSLFKKNQMFICANGNVKLVISLTKELNISKEIGIFVKNLWKDY